jgi:predicted secreted protein
MAKYSAFGCLLKRASTTIANVTNISGPGLSLDTEDVTSHDSTGGWEEVVGTILRSGEVTLDIVYDPDNATHKYASAGLLHDLVSRVPTTYNLFFSDSTPATWSFSALVTGFQPNMPVNGALTASVSLKLTGSVTLA